MSHQDDTIPISPSERQPAAARPLPAPAFDERSVRRARAAVPLPKGGGSRWEGKLPWLVLALGAGMFGGLLGIWALSYYQSADDAARAVPNPVASASPAAERVDAAARPQTEGASDAAQGDIAAGDGDAAATAAPAGASPASAGEEEELRGALAGWIDATNARDLERQMGFYDSRVATFYLTRNATREAVRAEKAAVFSRATKVDVRAGPPQIFLTRDGRTATMRFRKQYVIEGGEGRRGAVLQELRWRRTPQGWKIVGERDLRILD